MKFWLKILHFIFIRDFVAKVACVLLATFFWYYATVLSIEKTYINLPVEILNAPENLSLDFDKDTNVRVELQARDDISSYIGRISAVVDLSDASKGKNIFPITLQNLPAGINYDIIPKQLSIDIEDIISNTVPIVIEVRSNSQKDLRNYRLNPDKVMLIGSAMRLKQITSIKTDPLNLDNFEVNRAFSTNVKLRVPSNITMSPNLSKVFVEGQVLHYNVTNKILLPVTIENLKPSLVIPVSPMIEFTVLTASSNIEKLLLNTKVSVDFAKISNTGTHSVPVNIANPAELRILNSPKTISIITENDPELTQEPTNSLLPIETLEEMEEDLNQELEEILSSNTVDLPSSASDNA